MHGRRRDVVALWTALAGALLAWHPSTFALDPSLDISQYAHTAWRIRDGFSKGSIVHIAQTPDGYLWLGSEFGLLRFDGVRAVPWEPPAGEQVPSNYISALLVAHDGTLWIGTMKGLASWKDGKLTPYPEAAGKAVRSLAEDRRGTVWFGTYQIGKGSLSAIRGGKIQCSGTGTFGDGVISLYEDHTGNLWASAQTGLWRWTPGSAEQYKFPPGVIEANALIEDDRGVLLLATNDGLKQLVNGRIQSYSLPGVPGRFRPKHLFRSSDGSIWIGSHQGIWRLHQGQIDKLTAADGLSGDYIESIFEDREGNVWVSTVEGLDRFREYTVPTISRQEGLSNSLVWALQAAPDGSIWICTTGGLNRWQNGHVTVYGGRNVAGQNRRGEEGNLSLSGEVTEIANSGLAGSPRSSGLDDGGRVWVSTSDGVFRLEGDRFVRVPRVPGGNVDSIAGDGHGNVWIVHADLGLFCLTAHGAVRQIPWSRFGQNKRGVLLPDLLQGGVWLGFFEEGGLAYFQDGQVRQSYNAADGLGTGRITQLRLGSCGDLWAATEGGLSRIKDGRIATLTSRNGLPCDAVHWSMEDDDHDLWLYMPCGLARIARSELDAWVSDPKRVVQAPVFDNSDGVRSLGRYGGWGPHVSKSPDGKLWFATIDGASVIDPRHLPFNKLPPPVHIEQIIADRKAYVISNGLRLPPRVRDLTIDYTALSLAVPEKVHFRFKLEGQDKDWREVINDREVQYSNLAPRHYRFRVTACNNSGVWNQEGASVEFVIPPAWFQTNWFRTLCAATFLTLLWAAYQLRIRQLQEQERKFREAVETMPALAFIARRDGYRTFVNRRWVEYTGLTVDQASGSGWKATVHPDDLKRVIDKWRMSVATGEPLEYEGRLRRGADGEYRWFQVRAAPLRDKRGKVVRWCGVAIDIEDRKHAEQLQGELAHTNRVSLLGELAASISHELKQPIAATMTNARTSLRWLNRDQPDLQEARNTIGRIVRDGARATEIIDRLRSLYKKTPPDRTQVDVNDIIREMVVLLRGEANRCAVSMRIDLAADLPKITADPVQLQQVLMNLMLNAIEAMNETGGVLTIKSQRDENGRVLISVSDTGVGLPTGKADQIFNAFFTTKPQGSGMGLAISRSIVESHGGRLWAMPNDGRGATFNFTLPCEMEAHA